MVMNHSARIWRRFESQKGRQNEKKKKKRKTDRKKGRQKERKKEGISPYVSTMNAILLRMLSERYRSEHKYIYIDKIIGLFCKRAL